MSSSSLYDYFTFISSSSCVICQDFRCEFARYPARVVIHFECVKDPNICPITGQIFSIPEKSTSSEKGKPLIKVSHKKVFFAAAKKSQWKIIMKVIFCTICQTLQVLQSSGTWSNHLVLQNYINLVMTLVQNQYKH